MVSHTTRHIQNSDTATTYIFAKICLHFPQSLNANAGIVSLNKPPPLTSNDHFTSPLSQFKRQDFFFNSRNVPKLTQARLLLTLPITEDVGSQPNSVLWTGIVTSNPTRDMNADCTHITFSLCVLWCVGRYVANWSFTKKSYKMTTKQNS